MKSQLISFLGIYDFMSFVKQDFHKKHYVYIAILLLISITLNYIFDFEDTISDLYFNQIKGFCIFFSINAFLYISPLYFIKSHIKINNQFWILLFLSIVFLTLLQSTNFVRYFFEDFVNQSYFNWKIGARINSMTLYVLMIIILGILIGKRKYNLFGLTNMKINYTLYGGFLLMMTPLIIMASFLPDFRNMYPFLKYKYFNPDEYLYYFIRYEPWYLLNFIGLEWFFRGFMVLAFIKYVNSKAVIQVAILYCAFHFGKPIGECISSFFGGYILGYVVYKTKSIWGGVLVHMGIAFLMDIVSILSILYLSKLVI